MTKPKIALVHDYLPTFGGAEQVLSVLHEMLPEAPIYTIFSNVRRADRQIDSLAEGETNRSIGERDVLSEKFRGAKIITSWFDYIPFREKLMSPLLFLIPMIWASFDFSEYDLVISSASWAVTKGFGRRDKGDQKDKEDKREPLEICYCHTPPRYLYGYDTSGPWKRYRLVRIYAAICAHFMRLYDFKRAQKVTQFVANSKEVAARIEKFYRRDAIVINPPIDIPKIQDARNKKQNEEYYLTGGRLFAAKNFDLIIKACNELKLPLKVFGSGGGLEELKGMSGKTIEFLGAISEEEKFRLMAGCEAFIVAQKDEDFGITPVEAMACGAPVVAYRGGGYTETVVENKTGVFFDELAVSSLAKELERLRGLKIKPEDCRKQAEKFSKKNFIEKMNKLIASL